VYCESILRFLYSNELIQINDANLPRKSVLIDLFKAVERQKVLHNQKLIPVSLLYKACTHIRPSQMLESGV
jgi:hypothetical protein